MSPEGRLSIAMNRGLVAVERYFIKIHYRKCYCIFISSNKYFITFGNPNQHTMIVALFLLCILMIVPVRYQIIKGTMALNKDIPTPFWKVCAISIISELLITIPVFCFPLIFDERGAEELSGSILAGCVVMTAVVILAILLQLFASRVVGYINKKRDKEQAE
jgi:hypothetical protein